MVPDSHDDSLAHRPVNLNMSVAQVKPQERREVSQSCADASTASGSSGCKSVSLIADSSHAVGDDEPSPGRAEPVVDESIDTALHMTCNPESPVPQGGVAVCDSPMETSSQEMEERVSCIRILEQKQLGMEAMRPQTGEATVGFEKRPSLPTADAQKITAQRYIGAAAVLDIPGPST